MRVVPNQIQLPHGDFKVEVVHKWGGHKSLGKVYKVKLMDPWENWNRMGFCLHPGPRLVKCLRSRL
jgi:hypothetical protein